MLACAVVHTPQCVARLQYRNPWGRMRIGRALEDLDSMAGNIALAHSDDGDARTLPPLLVTAAVERIELRRPLELHSDVTLGVCISSIFCFVCLGVFWGFDIYLTIRSMRMRSSCRRREQVTIRALVAHERDCIPVRPSPQHCFCQTQHVHVAAGGQVVYTGTSSMDIRLALHQAGCTEPNLVAMFTFVARDPRTRKATPVNPLTPQTDQERAWYEERKLLAAQRRAARSAPAQSSATGAKPADSAGRGGDVGAGEEERGKQWTQGLLQEAQAMRMMPGEWQQTVLHLWSPAAIAAALLALRHQVSPSCTASCQLTHTCRACSVLLSAFVHICPACKPSGTKYLAYNQKGFCIGCRPGSRRRGDHGLHAARQHVYVPAAAAQHARPHLWRLPHAPRVRARVRDGAHVRGPAAALCRR